MHGSGERTVSVRAVESEDKRGIAVGDDVIHLVLPALRATVKAMSEVVLRQLVLHSVKSEAPLVDTVGIAAYAGAEVSLVVLREIIRHLVKAKNHVPEHSIPVGNHNRYDPATEIGDADLHAGRVYKGVEAGLRAIIN